MFPSNAFLTGMVQAYQPDKRYVARNLFAPATSESDKYEFDQTLWNRGITTFRNPTSVAGVTAVTGKKRITAKLGTITENKPIDERLLKWTDGVGKHMPERAQELLARELSDLNDIFDRTHNKLAYDLLRTGAVAVSVEGVSETFTFGLGGSATVTTPWSTVATATPIADLIGAKDQIQRNWGAPASKVIMGSGALKYLMQSAEALAILGETTKDQFAVMGMLEKISGLQIVIEDGGYYASGSFVPFLSDNSTNANFAVVLADGPVGQFVEAPPCDPKALENMYGRFAKTFESDNPAGRFLQMTQTALCGLTMPNKVYTLKLWT